MERKFLGNGTSGGIKNNSAPKKAAFPAFSGALLGGQAKRKGGMGEMNFCLPALSNSGFCTVFFSAPPEAGAGGAATSVRFLQNFLWRLASMLLFEIGSNFFIQGAPDKKRIPRSGIFFLSRDG